MIARRSRIGIGVACVSLGIAACGSASTGSSGAAMLTKIGPGEGALNIIIWAGYAEAGQDDPTVDWVTPFQNQTGCKVNAKIANTSDEMVALMETGQYDGVSASGNATLRLMAGGTAAPINVNLLTNYADINPSLKDQPYNTYNGVHYGVPHGWGANLLMWRTDIVKPAPDSWGVVFDANSPYKGKITAYDDPIYIADAALYLKATRPDLHITDPYELDTTQFNATVNLLKAQHTVIGTYWSDYTKEQSAFANARLRRRDHVAGHREPAAHRQESDPRGGHGAQGGIDGVVGHLDDVLACSTSELHVQVDELDHHPECAGAGCSVVRGGAREPQGVRHHRPD